VPSLWDINLQGFLNYLHETLPDIAIYAETQTADVFLRRIYEQTMDLAFIFDAPQTTDLDVIEVAQVPLVMVSTHKGKTINGVFSNDYVLVDWGTSFSTSHARHFSDAPSPMIRIGLGRVAKDFILSQGGTAYLPEPMVAESIENNALYYVKDAPVIDRIAYAIVNPSNQKQDLLKHALKFFDVYTEKVNRIF